LSALSDPVNEASECVCAETCIFSVRDLDFLSFKTERWYIMQLMPQSEYA